MYLVIIWSWLLFLRLCLFCGMKDLCSLVVDSRPLSLSFTHTVPSTRSIVAPLFVIFIKCLVCRTKFAQQAGSPLSPPLEPCTPTKSGLRSGSKGTPDTQAPCPEPLKVTFSLELDLLAQLYYTCISGKQPQDGINGPKTEKLCMPFPYSLLGF